MNNEMMIEKKAGIRVRTTLFLWIMASILAWLTFHSLIWAIQIAIMKLKHDPEMYTEIEGILFNLLMFVILDVKIILATILSWGLLYYFMNTINDTVRNMILSLSAVFILTAGFFLYEGVTSKMIEKDVVFQVAVVIYLTLLAPRLVFSKLKPGNILKIAS